MVNRMKRILAAILMISCMVAGTSLFGQDKNGRKPGPPAHDVTDATAGDVRLARDPSLKRYSVTERRKIDWTNEAPLIISEIGGGIFVRPGAKNEINLKGIKTAYSDNLDTARLEAGRLEIAVSAPSDRIEITTKLPSRRSAGEPGYIDYGVRVPSPMQLRLKTVSGEINAARLDGSVTAESVSGRIAIREVKGPVAVKTVAGNIEIGNCPETIQLASRAGRIDFEVDKLTAPSTDIESKSGDIRLTLPDSLNATIEISTVSGRIDVSGVSYKESGEKDGMRRLFAGKGESVIHISTISGNITLSKKQSEENRRFKR